MKSEIKITFYDGNGSVSSFMASEGNNVSNLGRINSDTEGYCGFYLGDDDNEGTPLDSGAKLFDDTGYPGFNSKVVWNGSTWWNPETHVAGTVPYIRFTVSGNDVQYATIVFDKQCNEYPLSVTVGSVALDVGSPELLLEFDAPGQYTVYMNSWSKRGAVAKVSEVRLGYTADYDASRIYKITASRQDRPQTRQLEFGLASQYADLTIYNNRADFARLADAGLLKENKVCEVWLGGVKVGEYLTSDYDIPGTEPQATIRCEDYLRTLHDEQYIGLDIVSVTMQSVLMDVLSGGALTVQFADGETEHFFSWMRSVNCYVETDSIFETLKKLSESTGCRMWNTGSVLKIGKCS